MPKHTERARKTGGGELPSEGSDDKRVIQPGPVPGMPVTQPDEQRDRPSLGSGAAEEAARDIEGRQERRQGVMDRHFNTKEKNKPEKE